MVNILVTPSIGQYLSNPSYPFINYQPLVNNISMGEEVSQTFLFMPYRVILIYDKKG